VALGSAAASAAAVETGETGSGTQAGVPPASCSIQHAFNGPYSGECASQIAFPLGGIGAGMFCLEGSGALSKFSLRHEPELTSEPMLFAALSVKSSSFARVLEGPVPRHKLSSRFDVDFLMKVKGAWGLPRYSASSFEARFPFARITLHDSDSPVSVRVTGWSPFEPGDEDSASLPVAALEYEFTNTSSAAIDAVFSFNTTNFMVLSSLGFAPDTLGQIKPIAGGFVLDSGVPDDKPWTAGAFAVTVDDPGAKVDHAWFRSRLGDIDAVEMRWQSIAAGSWEERAPVTEGKPAPGASISVPFALQAGATKKVVVRFAWYVPQSNLNLPGGRISEEYLFNHGTRKPKPAEACYSPWYAGRFPNVAAVMSYWTGHYEELRKRSLQFSHAFYDSTLPAEVLEAVSANLSILKSPTVLRQTDGRFWAWEGSNDESGSCEGSCTHVWNYAQALPHLFPRLERVRRETEFGANQNAEGHQDFRGAIPIRPSPHDFYAAADGQLGGIMKVYRDWRISGDTAWLRRLWPRVRASLDYCIRTWDPRHEGWLEEPHHNTYDIEFWGPDGMCSSIYLGALQAASLMGQALQEPNNDYARLLKKGLRRMESELFNGEYFIQKVRWQGLAAQFPEDVLKGYSHEAFSAEGLALARREGPEYQYGEGCLSDGVLGAWMAWACGVGDVLHPEQVKSHLLAVHKHNLKHDLTKSANSMLANRAAFATAPEGGLLVCSWPRGNKPSQALFYGGEVWTGIEYQVASHLIATGHVEEGLEIVRACRRRYDGRVRNPFDEVEAGHWYARAMASYALLQALSGARYDAVDEVLYLRPAVSCYFNGFLATETGYGTVGVKGGKPFVEVVSGQIPFKKIQYTPAA